MSLAFNDFLAIFPPSGPEAFMEKMRVKSLKAQTSEAEPEKVDEDGFTYGLDHVIVGQGELKAIEKVYPPPSSSYGVGWVVEEYIAHCMICDSEFGLLNWKFHCRACGYVVCGTCSPYNVPIPECITLGESSSKVCCNCFGFKSGRMQAARRSAAGSSLGGSNSSSRGGSRAASTDNLAKTVGSFPGSSSSSSAGLQLLPVPSSLLSEDLDERDEFVRKTKTALKAFEQAQTGKYVDAYT